MDPQILNGVVDMSSTDPHVTMVCPLCGVAWMKKVELNVMLTSPCDCKIVYSMSGTKELVNVEIRLNPAQTKIFNAAKQ